MLTHFLYVYVCVQYKYCFLKFLLGLKPKRISELRGMVFHTKFFFEF